MAFQDLKYENDDFVIEDGDFAIADSDDLHIKDILRSFQGEWKENPNCGVGLFKYLNSSGSKQQMKNEIAEQLTIDGYTINRLEVNTQGQINLDAERL